MRDKDTKFVATVPTVYGIETIPTRCGNLKHLLTGKLQQYLPFTVLKPLHTMLCVWGILRVATVLTVYGIETYIR